MEISWEWDDIWVADKWRLATKWLARSYSIRRDAFLFSVYANPATQMINVVQMFFRVILKAEKNPTGVGNVSRKTISYHAHPTEHIRSLDAGEYHLGDVFMS